MNSSWTFSSNSRIRTIGPVPVESVGGRRGGHRGRAPPGCRRAAEPARRERSQPGGTVSSFDYTSWHPGRGIVNHDRAPGATGHGERHAAVCYRRLKPLLEQDRNACQGDGRGSGAARWERSWMNDGRRIDVRRKRASMREVAELADVAISSVSRVLSEHPDVSPEMRERVLAAVAAARVRAGLPGPEPASRRHAVRRLRRRRHLEPADRHDHLGRRVRAPRGRLLDAPDELRERPGARRRPHPVLPGASGRRHDPVARERARAGDARRPRPRSTSRSS